MTGPVGYWVRATTSGRRRGAVVLIALTVVAAVVPLVAGAAARRTSSSVGRMREELRPYHVDVQFDEGPPPDDARERLASLDGVEEVGEGASVLGRAKGSDAELFQSFGQGPLDGAVGRTFERARIHAGRYPEAADEVLVSRRQAAELDLAVGDTFALEAFSAQAIEAIFLGEPVSYDRELELRIVGIGSQPEELTGGADSPAPRFVLPQAFFEANEGNLAWFSGIYLVRLSDGMDGVESFTRAAEEAFPGRADVAVHASEEGARIDDAVRAQSTALGLLALIAFITGTLAVGQAAIRLARTAETDRRVLSAVGFGRRQLVAARAGLVAGPVILGAVLAIVLAVGLSGRFPDGPAGRVEPDPGVRPDWPVLVGGGLLMVVLTLAAAGVLARSRVAASRPLPVAERLARGLPTVAAAVGLQGALRRRGGPASAATGSAMLALGGGVAGVVGALVFASSLTRLVETPDRFGWAWDYEVALGDELSDEDALAQAHALADDPRIAAASYLRLATKDLAGHPTIVFGVEPVRDELDLAVVAGRPARADDEVVLGRSTLEQLDAEVGDKIDVEVRGEPRALEVVGQGLFPTNENDDPAAGAQVTLATLQGLGGSGGFPDVFIDVARGVDRADLRADLEERFGAVTGTVPPPVVSNLELVDRSPYLLAAYLGALGIAAAAHAIVMVTRFRRVELATLRTLGFVRRQVVGTVLVHAATIAVVGLIVGLPLGLAVGRLAWRSVATGLGFAGDPRNPVLAVTSAPVAALVLALLVAAGPALWAARLRPSSVLRTE